MTPAESNEISKESTGLVSCSQNEIEGIKGDAKEVEGAKTAQVDADKWIKWEGIANKILAQLEGLNQLEIDTILAVVTRSLPTLFHLSSVSKPPE